MGNAGDLAAWIELSLVPGLGARTYRALLAAFGAPDCVFRATRSQLCTVVPAVVAAAILERQSASAVPKAVQWAESPGHSILTLQDPLYPKLLLEIPDPPPLLYVAGRTDLLNLPAVAIVGSRNATPHGLDSARRFGKALSECGLTIVSGLALGVDAAAHDGGMQGPGSTIAVLGTGVDIAYPKRNETLARKIEAHGALVSEMPLGAPPLAGNFPRRNRLISGMSRGCLVVEAAIDSGSLITARLAADQGREVFAIPGSIHSPLSKGCHSLIKQGAKLVESAHDVLEELGLFAGSGMPAPVQETDHAFLSKMGYEPGNLDQLVERTGLTIEVVSAMLLELELGGKVASLPGGLFQRVP